ALLSVPEKIDDVRHLIGGLVEIVTCGSGMQESTRNLLVSAEATVHRRRLPVLGEVARNFAAVFADPRMMFGIKLGLAGLLAVYISQLIRLGHANWGFFFVLLVAAAHRLGAASQREIRR